MMMSKKLLFARAAAMVIVAAAFTAHATPVDPQLRVLGIDVQSPFQSNSYEGRDRFANGNPVSGMVYTNNATGTQLTGGYSPAPFSAGSEATGAAGDLLGTYAGSGGLTFHATDGVLFNTNLTPSGYNAKNLNLSVSFIDASAGGSYQGLLGSNAGFDVFSVWNFSTPDAGGAYGLRLLGAGGNAPFQDLIDLRLVTSLSGVTSINLQRTSGVTGAGPFTSDLLGSVLLSDIYSGELSDVDYIVFDLSRSLPNGDNPGLVASINLLDANLDASGDIRQLAQYTFTAMPQIFHDVDFALVSARASWLEAIPGDGTVAEPETLGLLAAAMFGLVAARRRRR